MGSPASAIGLLPLNTLGQAEGLGPSPRLELPTRFARISTRLSHSENSHFDSSEGPVLPISETEETPNGEVSHFDIEIMDSFWGRMLVRYFLIFIAVLGFARGVWAQAGSAQEPSASQVADDNINQRNLSLVRAWMLMNKDSIPGCSVDYLKQVDVDEKLLTGMGFAMDKLDGTGEGCPALAELKPDTRLQGMCYQAVHAKMTTDYAQKLVKGISDKCIADAKTPPPPPPAKPQYKNACTATSTNPQPDGGNCSAIVDCKSDFVIYDSPDSHKHGQYELIWPAKGGKCDPYDKAIITQYKSYHGFSTVGVGGFTHPVYDYDKKPDSVPNISGGTQ